MKYIRKFYENENNWFERDKEDIKNIFIDLNDEFSGLEFEVRNHPEAAGNMRPLPGLISIKSRILEKNYFSQNVKFKIEEFLVNSACSDRMYELGYRFFHIGIVDRRIQIYFQNLQEVTKHHNRIFLAKRYGVEDPNEFL